jgi:glycerophosphoryl diester phosphodiesterase
MNNILAPFFYPNLPSIIGHRGAYNSAPENTLISFQKAAQLGARWVEIDVRLSSDKVPIIFHDNEVDRITNGQGPVGSFTLESLKQLDAGSYYHTDFSGEKIPTLLETIILCIELNLGMNIEIKPNYGQAAETVTAVLKTINQFQEHLKGNVLFSSFDFLCLEALINFSPEWPRALLVNDLNNDWLANTKALDCYALNPNYNCLTSIENIKSVLDSGLRLIPFTVNQVSTANKLLRLGINSIITDNLESLNSLQNYKM